MEEKRKFKRVPARGILGKCRGENQDRDFLINIRDLSPQGIGFESSLDIHYQNVEVILEIENHEIIFKGTLKWIKSKDSDTNPRYFGGLEITEISEQDRAILLIYYTKKLISLLLSPGLSEPILAI